jgi:hypothetical protein
LRRIAPGLALLIVFALVRPAAGQEARPTAAPVTTAQPRNLAQAWSPAPTATTPTNLTAPVHCAPAPEPDPVYTRASFWVTVGIVAVAGIVTGVLLERSRHHGLDMPTTTYGTKEF